jgi:hypothetical protein
VCGILNMKMKIEIEMIDSFTETADDSFSLL